MIYFTSTNPDSGPKNGSQSFLMHSALDDVRWSSEFNIEAYGVGHRFASHQPVWLNAGDAPNQTTYRVHKVRFSGDVYRSKTQFIGKIYWNRYRKCWAIFPHIRLRNWHICHTLGPTFVPCVVEIWVWNHCDTLLRLCHSELSKFNVDINRRCIEFHAQGTLHL